MRPPLRLILVPALALAAVVSATGITRADLPAPGEMTVPAHITLVGHVSGSPDAAGTFEVIVRSFPNTPVPSSMVLVDFSNAPDIRLSSDVAGPGAVVDCPTRTVRAITDVNGRVVFTIVGGSGAGAAQCLPEGSSCTGKVRIYADGMWIGEAPVSAFDLDGTAGVSGGDLSVWLADFATGLHPLRSDYDGSAFVGGGDLSLWLARFGSGGSQQSGGTYCP